MAYSPTNSDKLTHDTDDGRINSSPSIVRLPTDQQISFYSKFLTTGKESYSRITFTSPSFNVDVEAGSGTINGVPVIWSADTLVASPNSYEYVYVTNTGNLDIGSNLSMTFLKDVILLASVSSGNSSITIITEFEHTGNYVYARKQSWTGTEWVWDDYEDLLNTGAEPRCFYDIPSGYIYLMFKKDSSSYVRTFNPADELTWEYLPNIAISAGTITLNQDPENSTAFSISSGYKTSIDVESNLYPVVDGNFSFKEGVPYVYLPNLMGDFVQYATSDITYEFFTLVGATYVLEDSYVLPLGRISSYSFSDNFRLWTGTTGTKYLGVRLYTSIFMGEYATNPSNYGTVDIYDYPAQVLFDTNYDVDTRDNILVSSVSSAYKNNILVTAEFEETKSFQTDNYDISNISSGYKSDISVTAEFEETKSFSTDNYNISNISSGYKTVLEVTSLPI